MHPGLVGGHHHFGLFVAADPVDNKFDLDHTPRFELECLREIIRCALLISIGLENGGVGGEH